MLITTEKFLKDVGKQAIKGNFYDAEHKCHDDWMEISRKMMILRDDLAEKRLIN